MVSQCSALCTSNINSLFPTFPDDHDHAITTQISCPRIWPARVLITMRHSTLPYKMVSQDPDLCMSNIYSLFPADTDHALTAQLSILPYRMVSHGYGVCPPPCSSIYWEGWACIHDNLQFTVVFIR